MWSHSISNSCSTPSVQVNWYGMALVTEASSELQLQQLLVRQGTRLLLRVFNLGCCIGHCLRAIALLCSGNPLVNRPRQDRNWCADVADAKLDFLAVALSPCMLAAIKCRQGCSLATFRLHMPHKWMQAKPIMPEGDWQLLESGSDDKPLPRLALRDRQRLSHLYTCTWTTETS